MDDGPTVAPTNPKEVHRPKRISSIRKTVVKSDAAPAGAVGETKNDDVSVSVVDTSTIKGPRKSQTSNFSSPNTGKLVLLSRRCVACEF